MHEISELNLDILKKFSRKKGDLAEDAKFFMDDFDQTLWKNQLKENQLRNVINIANETECVPVVTNFIRYQIGRHSEWRKENFGERLIEKIDNLKESAKEIDERDVDDAWIKLTRLYLGFMVRYYKYLVEKAKENK